MPTGKQIRAARVLAGWDAKDLAPRASMSVTSIQNIERGDAIAKATNMEKIVKAFSDVGIEFTENEGIRRRPEGVEVFEGPERFEDFYKIMYEHLEKHGGEVCLSAENEKFFAGNRSPAAYEKHKKIMRSLVKDGKVTFRVLAHESANFNSATYTEYRWQPEKGSSPTAFYAFGDCLALVSFDHTPSPYVVLHKSGSFASVYRKSFEDSWQAALPLPKEEE